MITSVLFLVILASIGPNVRLRQRAIAELNSGSGAIREVYEVVEVLPHNYLKVWHLLLIYSNQKNIKLDMDLDVYRPHWFKLGMMLDTMKLYIFILVRVTLAFILGHRDVTWESEDAALIISQCALLIWMELASYCNSWMWYTLYSFDVIQSRFTVCMSLCGVIWGKKKSCNTGMYSAMYELIFSKWLWW